MAWTEPDGRTLPRIQADANELRLAAPRSCWAFKLHSIGRLAKVADMPHCGSLWIEKTTELFTGTHPSTIPVIARPPVDYMEDHGFRFFNQGARASGSKVKDCVMTLG